MLLHNRPRLKYNGLTIILSNPSRFDSLRLLTATGGQLFDNHCLRPEYNSLQCDIRLMEDKSEFLPETKCLLILGEAAMFRYLPETLSNTLNEMRGSPFTYRGIPVICSYLPQDAADYKNYEAQLNPLSTNYSPDDSISDDDEEEGDVKRFAKTKRSNYAFWLRRDVWKVKQILSGNVPNKLQPKYYIYPSSEEVINILIKTKDQELNIDLETDFEEQNLQCFAFSFDGLNIYSVPVLDYNYKWAYSSLHFILRALAIAIRDNTTIAYNGATFDFFVLGHKYKIPIREVVDPMIGFQRCFPDVERSLGHFTSYWTWERFHKDEDSISYRTQQQMMDRLAYCGKDVFTMTLGLKKMREYAKSIPGLELSINTAMTYIRPYLTSTLFGINTDTKKIAEMINENDRLMFQYNRMIELLLGPQALSDCRSAIKGKAKFFAGSNVQCCEYFHRLMGYTVVAKSPKTQKPSLGKKALYKLALKYDNPIINLICAYRAKQKETSRLKFTPWFTNENTNTLQLGLTESI